MRRLRTREGSTAPWRSCGKGAYNRRMKAPEAVLKEYGITADSIESLSFGHIHGTYKVHADGKTSILQFVNPIFGSEVMEDIEAVTVHLRRKGVPAFEVLKTSAGGLFVPDE